MANLWQFFGLPDPEGNNPPSRRQAPAPTPDSEPVSLNAKPVEETTDSTELADPPAVEATATTPLRTPPLDGLARLRPMENRFTTLAWWLSALPSIRTKRSDTSLPIR